MKIIIKSIVFGLLFCSALNGYAQNNVNVSIKSNANTGNDDVKFVIKPKAFDADNATFAIGGQVESLPEKNPDGTFLGTVYLCFLPENVIVKPKNAASLTQPKDKLLWKVTGSDADKNFIFKLNEGFKGGDVTVTINKYTLTDNDGKKILAFTKTAKTEITVKYAGLPEIKSSEEVKEVEIQKLYDTLQVQLKKLEPVSAELEKRLKVFNIAEVDAADTEKLKKIAADLRVIKKQLETNRVAIQKISNQCKDEKLKDIKTKAAEILKKNQNVGVILNTMLTDSKIVKIREQEEHKVRKAFLPRVNATDSAISILSDAFKLLNNPDNKDGIRQTTNKIKAKTITVPQARKTVEAFLADSLKYNELQASQLALSSEYAKAVPQLDDLDSLMSENDKAIWELQTQMIKASNDIQDLKQQAPPADNSLIYIIIGVVLAGGVLAFFAVRYFKSKKIEDAEIKEKEAISEIEFDIDETKSAALRGAIADLAILKKGDYIQYTMNDMWQNSMIKTCHLHKNVISEIYKISREEQRKAAKSGENVAPEIGGFLLGRYLDHKNETYDLVIDEYMQPSETEHQDVYQIKFGTTAMHDLDKALELNPDKALVGWFHTHPGHSPFLSQPDMNIHNGTFTQNWQVAIVVDPYNEYDTGIFTRFRPEPGKRPLVNNNGQLKWVKWNELYAKINTAQRKTNLPQVVEGKYFTVEMSKFWKDSKVSKVNIAYDLVFDLEDVSHVKSAAKDIEFIGQIFGYFDEIEAESNVYQLYLNKLVKDDKPVSDQAKVAWLGISADEMATLQNNVLELTKKNLKNPYEIGVLMTSGGLKISFLSLSKDNKLNFKTSGDYFIEFAEINRWTMKKQ